MQQTTTEQLLKKQRLQQKALNKFTRNLLRFVNSDSRSRWICTDVFKVYVRKACHRSSSLLNVVRVDNLPTLDLANIEVCAEHQGCGVFRRVSQIMATVAKSTNRHLFVESVSHPYIRTALLRRGFAQDLVFEDSNVFVSNFWKFRHEHI